MDKAVMMKIMLISMFFLGGAFMLLLGILIWRRLWDGGSVEVDAERIDAQGQTVVLGTGSDRIVFHNVKRPIYLYFYEGKRYTASPLLACNRPAYDPVFGRCKVRINPKHPGKVYSPARRFAARMLIGVGAIWIVIAALLAALLPT